MRFIAVVTVLVGCGAPAMRQDVSATPAGGSGWSTSAPGDDGPLGLYDGSGRLREAPAGHVLAEGDLLSGGDTGQFASVSVGSTEPAAAAARPRRVGKRDLALRNARLDNALRYLAHEGRFNLVVEGELATPVTLELRAVEPYDAAMALAEAHHLAVRDHHGILIVTQATAAPAAPQP